MAIVNVSGLTQLGLANEVVALSLTVSCRRNRSLVSWKPLGHLLGIYLSCDYEVADVVGIVFAKDRR